MLHFACWIGKARNVSEFHQFQRAFLGYGSREASAEEKNGIRLAQQVHRFVYRTDVFQVGLHQVRRLLQSLHEFTPFVL